MLGVFGKFTEISREGTDTIVTIAVEGEDMRFNRGPTSAPAVTSTLIGQGIQGDTGTNSIVVAAAVAADTRGVIIGGNTSQGTADAPGFFRVNFRSS